MPASTDSEIVRVFTAVEEAIQERLIEAQPELADSIKTLTVIGAKLQCVVGTNFFAKVMLVLTLKFINHTKMYVLILYMYVCIS